MSIVRIKVLFFASAREDAGTGEVELELEEGKQHTSHLLDLLTTTYPDLDFEGKMISVAVNKVYLGEEDVLLKNGDEVALLPPISGG
jgi:molybdopterin converting factor subunit 1